MSTSASATRRLRTSTPAGDFRSSAMSRLFRLMTRYAAASPSLWGGQVRDSSPEPVSSTLITSAPRSDRSMPQNGPARTREQSMTRIPSRDGGQAVVSATGPPLSASGERVTSAEPARRRRRGCEWMLEYLTEPVLRLAEGGSRGKRHGGQPASVVDRSVWGDTCRRSRASRCLDATTPRTICEALDSGLRHTSRPDRTRSLPMRGFESGHEDVGMQALLDLLRRGGF